MRILAFFIFLCLNSCSSQNKSSSSNTNNKQAEKTVLPVKVYIESSTAVETILEITKRKITQKNIKVLNDEEFKELTEKHFRDAFKNAGGKDLNTLPSQNRMNDALKTTPSYINCLTLYCTVRTENQMLVFDSLYYNQSEYPRPKKITHINFNVERFQDKSLLPVLDSLINHLFKKE